MDNWKEETRKWLDAEVDRLYTKGKGGKSKGKGKGKGDGCLNCGGTDHWSRECPHPQKGKGKDAKFNWGWKTGEQNMKGANEFEGRRRASMVREHVFLFSKN